MSIYRLKSTVYIHVLYNIVILIYIYMYTSLACVPSVHPAVLKESSVLVCFI